MNLPVQRWYDAIEPRHSTRIYDSRPVESEKLEILRKLCAAFRPADGVRAELKTSPGENLFRGIVGGYGKIKGNHAYMAFIGRPDAPHVEEMIGYLGEGFILEATALGLATCWIGGFFRREEAGRELGLADGERIYALTPLGYPLERLTFEERMMRGFRTERKRKPMEKLVSGIAPQQWPSWVRAGLEAARIAPSAANRQPWHFIVDEESVTLTTEAKRDLIGVSRRLDCGIAMLHFELGALSQEKAVTREMPEEGAQVARFGIK